MKLIMHLSTKMLFLLLGAAIVFVGCGVEDGNVEGTTGTTTGTISPKAIIGDGELDYKEVALQEAEVVEGLKAKGVTIIEDSANSYISLNKVEPSTYKLDNNEKVYIYVYENSYESVIARKQYYPVAVKMDMKMPMFYALKNVLILYDHNELGDHPQKRLTYHVQIEAAIEQLLGDEIYNEHGNIYNLAKLDSFQNSFSSHQNDQLKVTSLTVEGDRIYTYLLTDGTKLLFLRDNSEDSFGGTGKGVQMTECTTIEKKPGEGAYSHYSATGCKNEQENHIISVDNASLK